MTGVSPRTINTVIKDLAQMHIILIDRKNVNNKTRNKYYLTHQTEWLLDKPEYAVRSTHPARSKETENTEIYKINQFTETLVAQKRL